MCGYVVMELSLTVQGLSWLQSLHCCAASCVFFSLSRLFEDRYVLCALVSRVRSLCPACAKI